ncbi:MAG: hypothetical protein ACK4WC_16250 [Rubrimonas sp.]
MIDRRAALAGLAAAATAGWPLRAAELLEMERLYGPEEDRTGPGPIFSDLARRNDGRRVRFRGFMAPPLIAETNFFVLADIPMAICPFCDTESEWPNNIVSVFAKRVVEVTPFHAPIEVEGVLRLGPHLHEPTGFLSLVRLDDATLARL